MRAHIDKYIKWTELPHNRKASFETFAAELSSSQVQKRPLKSENYDIMFAAHTLKQVKIFSFRIEGDRVVPKIETSFPELGPSNVPIQYEDGFVVISFSKDSGPEIYFSGRAS